ncbi:MAG: 5'/3'-nucleotidase SurE [Actinomycetota bacterium]
MRLLVTNDDGIDSPGLHALAERMTELGEVTVFAPSGQYSGAGAAIGHLGGGVPPVTTVDRHPSMPGVAAVHHLDGPPGLAALLACRGLFGDPPDVVVSGINPGWNVGNAVHFSGTIGACITAYACGVGGLAISQRSGSPQRWATAAEAAAELIPVVAERPTVLSANVDNLEPGETRGFRWVGLGQRLPYNLQRADLADDGTVSFERGTEVDRSLDVDTGAVLAGHVAVTELTPTCAARATDGQATTPLG